MDELSSPMMYSGTAQNISLSATATDADGYVQQVAFYVNGDLVGTDTSSPYAAGYDINASGMYEVYAVASDDDGNDITSTVQHILVLEGVDVEEPLSLSTPDGTYLGGIAEITALYKSPTENYDSSIQAHVYIDSEYAGTATKLPRFEPAPGDEDPGIAFTYDLATETAGSLNVELVIVNGGETASMSEALQVDESPLTDDLEFLLALWEGLFDRKPKGAEINGYLAALRNGSMSRQQVISKLPGRV